MKMKKKSKRLTFIVVAFVLLFVVTYACLAIIPFSSDKSISEAVKNNFSASQFYDEEEGIERAKILDDPQESFYYRLQLIHLAKEEIILSSYSTHDGRSTRVFFGALLKKADEGVSVSIVLDGKFSGMKKEALQTSYSLINHPNISLYYYNELNVLNPLTLNACLHDKYLIVDQQFMILGGRNIGDKYYAEKMYEGSISFDREVLVYNPFSIDSDRSAITQTKAYFQQVISETCCKKQEKLSKKKQNKAVLWQESLIEGYENYLKSYPELMNEIDFTFETVRTNKITLVTNPTHPHLKEPVIGFTLYQLALQSKSVYMQSPYTILDSKHLKLFSEINEQCEQFILLTNSLASTPNLMGYSNYYVRRKEILKTGVEIYEYQSNKNSLHAKTYLFDDRLTAIGSFNLDERSVHIDTESMLIIDSVELNRQAKEVLNEYLEQSLQVNEDNQYVKGNIEAAPVSTSKKVLYKVTGTLARPFVSLL